MTWSSLWMVAAISFAVFLIVALGMAVGVMFGRRSIGGSCGGLANRKDGEGRTACSVCENPAEACRELQQADEGAGGKVPGEETEPHPAEPTAGRPTADRPTADRH